MLTLMIYRNPENDAPAAPAMAGNVFPVRFWPATRSARFFMIGCLLLAIGGCDSNRHLSFLDPQGPIAAATRTHFIWVLVILGVFVALPIFVLTPLLAWRYRYGATSPRYSPGWKASLPLEIITWAGPIVIVLGVLVWRYAHRLDPYQPINPGAQALQVQVIGYDWKWLFIYPEAGVASVGVMAIPVGRPVALRLTSATVMQSLHIPALVSQIYAMGGMVTQLHLKATQPGRSLGMNNMYSGKGFHQQRFSAIAMPAEQFQAWVRKAQQTGVSMSPQVYAKLSQSSTVADLTEALPQASRGGNLFFRHVSAGLFPAVVHATMTDTRTALAHLLKTPAKAGSGSRNADAASTEPTP